MSGIGIVLLAAGGSSRLGQPKQLLRYDNETLLRRAARLALETEPQAVVAVLGSNAQQMTAELDGLPVHCAVNPDWQTGMGSSIRTGIRELQVLAPDLDVAILLLCDQPLLTSNHLQALLQTFHTTRKPIIASSYNAIQGTPCLFHRSLFAELEALDGANGAKPLLTKHQTEIAAVPFPEGAIDIDTPEDYARFKNGQDLPSPPAPSPTGTCFAGGEGEI